MSGVSDVFDAYVSVISTALPVYSRIPNPYLPEENTELLLRKAFGVAFGPSLNSERFVSCNRETELRTFDIILINQVLTTDDNTSARETQEKSLMEDLFLIKKAVVKDGDLQGAEAVKSKFLSDDGITFLEAERHKYYFLQAQFESEYFDTVL